MLEFLESTYSHSTYIYTITFPVDLVEIMYPVPESITSIKNNEAFNLYIVFNDQLDINADSFTI